jgi:F-type H+-transporting ATPase subunit a
MGVLWLFELLLGQAEDIMGSRDRARRIMPLALTLFFFILVNNWLELLPLVGPLTWNGRPLLRGLAADLNFTFALAIITMSSAQIWAIRSRGWGGNLGRYLANPFTHPFRAFDGMLQLVAEFSRGMALSLRLFGNIFGGEVLLVVAAFVSSWAAPVILPAFMLFELFIGAVQAYIFFMLAVVFASFGLDSEDEAAPPAPITLKPAVSN